MTNTHICAACGEPFPSAERLRQHRCERYPTGADRGPSGTPFSGQTGTTPPTGTGGVATP